MNQYRFFFTLILALSFFASKFINVNTDSNKTYNLQARFLSAGGINVGNDVKMRGLKSGLSNVSLDNDYFAVVNFEVYEEISIPRESIVKVASDGILGNKYLSISPDGDLSNTLKISEEIKKVENYESIEDQVSKIIFLATQ